MKLQSDTLDAEVTPIVSRTLPFSRGQVLGGISNRPPHTHDRAPPSHLKIKKVIYIYIYR